MINENKDFIVIDFTGLFKAVMKRFWIVLLIGLVGALGAGLYARYKQQNEALAPMFQSTAKIYVTGNYAATPSAGAKTLGQSFIADYFELMRSRKVLDQVISDLELNMTRSELYSCITWSSVSGTCMVYVTVTFPDPELAKEIVDELLLLTSSYAREIMGMTPPKIYEESQVPLIAANAYSSISSKKYAIYGGAAGAGVVLLLVILLFLLDNKLRTPKQLKSRMPLPMLSALINYKTQKGVKYNRIALQNLFGYLYVIKENNQVITFLSGEKEDKMELIRSFAFSLTQMKKKVIIIDANLSFTTGKNGNRLEEYLLNDSSKLSNVIYQEDDIDLIDNEEPVANAVELLSSAAFKQLISELRASYDYILINTTPTEYAADARPVLEHADACIAVVEVGKTRLGVCDKMNEQYNHDGKLTGIVITNVKLKKKSKEFKQTFGRYMGII